MTETMEILIACCLSLTGIGFALLLISRLRQAEATTRLTRLAALDMRISGRTRDLNAILIAENAKLIAKGIDQGSLYLETGHRVVSEVTFGLLQLFPSTRGHAQRIKETHNAISQGIYGAFREINKHIGGSIADGLKNTKPGTKRLSAPKTRRIRAKVAAKKKSR